MPPKKKTDNALAASIIFASVVLSGSLVFFGLQLDGKDLQGDVLNAQIEKGIEAYVERVQQEQQAAMEADQAPTSLPIAEFIDDDAVLGDPDAPITIVEFSDYECPFCERFYSETMPTLKTEYIDTGLVKLVFRDNPLSFHPNAYPAALAAECVRDQLGDEGYFVMHDAIFEGSGLELSTLEGYARDAGADLAEYNTCIVEEKFRDEIYADQAQAQSVNLTGTPSFIINGTVIEGAQPLSVFQQVIDAELAK